MALENEIEKLTAAVVALTEVTAKLVDLRADGLNKVSNAVAQEAAKVEKKAAKADKKAEAEAPAEKPAETPAAAPEAPAQTVSEETGEVLTVEIIGANVVSFVTHEDEAEEEARIAKVQEILGKVGADRVGNLSPEHFEIFNNTIDALKEKVVKEGNLTKPAAPAKKTSLI